jgi:hypothetical protein
MLVCAKSRAGSSSSAYATWAWPRCGCRQSLAQWPDLPQLRQTSFCAGLRLPTAPPWAPPRAPSSSPSLGASLRLAWLAALAAVYHGRRLPLLPLTSTDLPLLPSEVEFAANGDRV